jgi:hypothetical protein
MIKARNDWCCTDPDCLQHGKKISETEFKFIQAVWLDTCEGDTRAINAKDDSDNYAVCAGFIDLDLYPDEDIEGSIGSYGYTLKSIKEIYGEDANYIIAECLFEDHCLYDCGSIAGVVSWDDAKVTIQNYIDEN